MGEPLALIAASWIALAMPPSTAEHRTSTRRRCQDTGEVSVPTGERSTRKPPPPQPIAGISGFDSLSRLFYATSPDQPHELRVTCVFPERIRWMISTKVGGLTDRQIEYRFGEAVYRIPPGTSDSEECEGPKRSETILRMELRRALMLYPDGFSWSGEGSERTAQLGELGRLCARIAPGSGGKPAEIWDVDAEGKVVDTIKGVTWREMGGRVWPASMELWRNEERIWSESIQSVDTAARFVDSFFVPPDRRDGSTRQPIGGSVRDLDIPATCSHRTALAAGTSWKAALEELEVLRTSWAQRLAEGGLALERTATVEISDSGEPVACILRLTTLPADPPDGFSRTAGRRGKALAVKGFDGVSSQIERLGKALPGKVVRGRPYVRFDPSLSPGGQVVLVIPFSPEN